MIIVGVIFLLLGLSLAGYVYVAATPQSKSFVQRPVKRTTEEVRSTSVKEEKITKKINKTSFKEKLFKAGIISDVELRKFFFILSFSPAIGFLSFAFFSYLVFGKNFLIPAGILGALLGFLYPHFYLRKRTIQRQDEISYYLPIVIEQIAIGVSSSLDIGPCIQLVIDLADERGTNNVVTEFLKLSVQLSRQGIPFDEALLEVGKLSRNVELKHCFLALGQVYKHGGEISKQLMEIAKSVTHQRQVKIDEKIKKLPLKGVLVVAMMVFSFLIILVYGLGFTLFKQITTGLGN